MRLRTLFSLIIVTLSCAVFADGPRDNQPENVRRVPQLGIEVQEGKRDELQSGLDKLKDKIDALKLASKDHPQLSDRIPDIEILHRAVHDALTYQEFFKESEINDAFNLLSLGSIRARGLERQLQRFERVRQKNPDAELELEPMARSIARTSSSKRLRFED